MDYAIDQSFYTKARMILDKLEKNQKLQQLASANGIDVKNSTHLNEATKNNIATSVIALMLAKQNNDPRYNELVRLGMGHRQTKIDLINSYKDQANQIITRAKNNDFQTLSGFAEEYIDESDECDINDEELFQEFKSNSFAKHVFTSVIAGFNLQKIASVIFVLDPSLATALGVITVAAINVAVFIYTLVRLMTRISPKKILKKLEKIPVEKRNDFTMNIDIVFGSGDDKTKLLSVDDIIGMLNEFTRLVSNTIAYYDGGDSALDTKVIKDWDEFSIKYDTIISVAKEMKKNQMRLAGKNIESGMSSNVHSGTTLNYTEAVQYAKTWATVDVSRIEHLAKLMAKHLSKLEKEESKLKIAVRNKELMKQRNDSIERVCKKVAGTAYQLTIDYSKYMKSVIKYNEVHTGDVVFDRDKPTQRHIKEAYDMSSDDGDYHRGDITQIYEEGVVTSLATGLGAILASLSVATVSLITAALSVLIYGLSAFIQPLSSTKPETVLKRLEKIPPDERKDFSIDVELKWKIGEFLSVDDIEDILFDFEKLINYTVNEYKDAKLFDRVLLLKWNEFDLKYQKVFARVKHMKLKPNQSESAPKKTTLNYDEAVDYAKKLKSIDVKKVKDVTNKMKEHLKQIREQEKRNRSMENNYYAKDIHNYEINKTTRDFTIKMVCNNVQRTIIPLVGNYADYLNAIIKYQQKHKKQTTDNEDD